MEKESYCESDRKLFRSLLEEKLKTSQEEIALQKAVLENSNNSTDSTFRIVDPIENAELDYIREECSRVIGREVKISQHLKEALVRLINNPEHFGKCYCPICNGRLIPKERLIAVPHATKCVAEKKNN